MIGKYPNGDLQKQHFKIRQQIRDSRTICHCRPRVSDCLQLVEKGNLMKKSVLMLLLCASGVSFQAAATDSAMKKDYDAANDRASADYQAARKACDGQGGNRKAICIEEAKAQQVRVKSDARAAYIDTPKARVNARKAVADADFDVAREKCKI
ncbi:MAG: hypothetical protein ACRYF5_11790, partial [Janthinobacterium lividum]